MSDFQDQILTRDELSSLISNLREAQNQDDQRGRLMGSSHFGEQALIQRAGKDFEKFASLLSEKLSSRYQLSIRVEISDVRLEDTQDVCSILMPEDPIGLFETAPSQFGGIVMNRPFFFSWYSLALGARRAFPTPYLDGRTYSKIERRFSLRFAEELVQISSQAVPERISEEARVVSLDDRDGFLQLGNLSYLIIEFRSSGLNDAARLNLILPRRVVTDVSENASDRRRKGTADVEGELLSTPVFLRAQVGTLALPLSRLAHLQVGDVLQLGTRADQALKVEVEGAHKFDGIRGRLGSRRAVRIMNRVSKTGTS